MKKPTKKESKPMKLEVKKINTKQYKTREEYNEAHKNDKQVEDKKKRWKVINAREKQPPKYNKTEMKKKKIIWSWRKITLEDEPARKYFVWRPRIFKNWEELLKLFNCYIASCLERFKKTELVPIRTEDKENDFLEILDEEIQSSKNENIKIDNKLISEYEIIEDIKRKETPTIWGFLNFLGWISYTTWENYQKKEEYVWVIEQIQNYCESVLTQRALDWEVPANSAQFVLNVHYNRVPKSKSEEVIKTDPIDESEFINN